MGEGCVYTRVCAKPSRESACWGLGLVSHSPTGTKALEGDKAVVGAGGTAGEEPAVWGPLLPGRRQALPACSPCSVWLGRGQHSPALFREHRCPDCWGRGRLNPPATPLGRRRREVRSQGHRPTWEPPSQRFSGKAEGFSGKGEGSSLLSDSVT